ADANGTALSRQPPDGRSRKKFAAGRRARAGLARPFAEFADRKIHARALYPHAKYFSHHAHAGTPHGAAAAKAGPAFPARLAAQTPPARPGGRFYFLQRRGSRRI